MQCKHLYSIIAAALSLAAVGTWAAAPPLWDIPNIFHANTAASASEVNANFQALHDQIVYLRDENTSQNVQIQNLMHDVTTLLTSNTDLQTRLVTVEGNTVLSLDGKLGLGVDLNTGQPTARFTAVNVQIVNGTDTTYGTPNGVGNLIIGYDELSNDALEFCSNGAYVDSDNCVDNNYIWAARQRSGSHNLILGVANAYSRYGGLIAGEMNVINGPYASVNGGSLNIASGVATSIGGGWRNIASGRGATVSGGNGNTAKGEWASVSGGISGLAEGQYSSVTGGAYNIASGNSSSVSGGRSSNASGASSVVSGGYSGKASDTNSTVSGGYHGTASGQYASISGGYKNTADGIYSSISGGRENQAHNTFSSISGGYNNATYGFGASISGGDYNVAGGQYSSISGGVGNRAGETESSVSGGQQISTTVAQQWCGGGTTSAPNCH